MADKQYQAHLIQHEWVTTEVFDITAKDQKSAQAEADKIIKTKDLDGREYKVEIKEADQPEADAPVVPEPTEPVER